MKEARRLRFDLDESFVAYLRETKGLLFLWLLDIGYSGAEE